VRKICWTSRSSIPRGASGAREHVDLAELRTNGNVELRIAQVSGLAGAVRGCYRGWLRRHGAAAAEKLPKIDRWEFVNLIEPDPLRREIADHARKLETAPG